MNIEVIEVAPLKFLYIKSVQLLITTIGVMIGTFEKQWST